MLSAAVLLIVLVLGILKSDYDYNYEEQKQERWRVLQFNRKSLLVLVLSAAVLLIVLALRDFEERLRLRAGELYDLTKHPFRLRSRKTS